MNVTHRFGLTTFDRETDRFDANDNKFGAGDRIDLDRILAYALEAHVHTGVAMPVVSSPAPVLEPVTVGGTIGPGLTVYYKYAIVDDRGQIERASQVAAVNTQTQLPTPAAVTGLTSSASGGLLGGSYLYAVSVYNGTTNQETMASPTVSGVLAGTGSWSFTLPGLPSGANGWNVYRQGPGDDELLWLTSMETSWIRSFSDIGLNTPDQRRPLPVTNTSFTANSVVLHIPDLPAGATARIYRTTNPANWERSLLDWVAFDYFTDTGQNTRAGVPPALSSGAGGAPKINLTDNTEVTGVLPPGRIAAVSVASFTFTGPVTPGAGNWMWINEFDHCELVSMRCTLQRGSMPAAQPIKVELSFLTDDVWHDVFGLGEATIAVGETRGDVHVFPFDHTLLVGEALRPIITQSGGGATPTDFGLSVTVTLRVGHGSTVTSYIWEST